MYKCKICGKKYTELTALYSHIENKHKDMIPKDMSVQQFYYYMKTGRTNGNCVMCKKPTSWNHNTGKYNRFCGDEKCKEEYVKIMKGRMVAKYGKTHLLNDPNKQREMLANRSISGVYKWSDGKHETTYTGSYELDFLRTLDDFFDWDPEDISMPSPHTYTYKYEGEDKFYIPDVFIHSLDLEIEIKDGGDNPNNHHKIQEVDKEKERLKDEVLCSQKAFHYVKITNKNYENFFRFLKEIKKAFEKFEDETKIPRIFKIEDIKGTNVMPVKESWDIVEEGLIEKLKGKILKIKDPYNMSYEELKAKVDNAKKLYKQNITDGTIKLSEPNHVHYYTTELENEKRRVDNLIQNIHDEDGKKTWILKHYYEWLDQFEANLIKDMVKMLKDDVRDSKAKLTKSFSNCKDESDYKEFITAVTYLISYYRKLSNLVDIPEVKAHCKWLEMMHGKACDKAGIGDGPLVFESEEYCEEKFEGFQKDAEKLIKKYDKFSNTKYNDADMFLSLQYNLAKNSPKELQRLLSKLIKYAKCDDDFRYVEKLVGDSETHYHYLLDKHPNLKDEYELYYDWIKKGGMEKEIKDRKKDLKKSKKKIQEALDEIDFVEENVFISKDNVEVNLDKFGRLNKILYITGLGGSGKSTIISKYAKEYGAEALEFDAVTSALIKGLENLNRNKIHPIILEYLETQNPIKLNGFGDPAFNTESVKFLDWFENKVAGDGKLYIIEGMQLFICFEPERFIDKSMIIMGTSVTKSMFRSVSRTYKRSEGDIIKTFKFFLKTLKRIPIFVKNDNQINELIDTISECYVEEKFEPDKFLVWFDKPIQKLKGGKIKLYHGTLERRKGNTFVPFSINVGATKYSDPRWSIYFWDNREDAMLWSSARAVMDIVGVENMLYIGHNEDGKVIVKRPKGMTDKEFANYLIEKSGEFYIYEVEADIKDLEVGARPIIREYTVSKPVDILKEYKYKLNKEIIRRCVHMVDEVQFKDYDEKYGILNNTDSKRGSVLNAVLDPHRNSYRPILISELRNGNIRPGDDISDFRYSINRHLKANTYNFESYIIDTMEESSISIPQMNYYLQNQYEEEMRRYLNTYKKYYNLMLKEQPSAVKHINEDIKKCLIVIDGMASKGVENNLVQFAKDDLGEIVKAAKHGKPVKVYETFGDYIEERAGKLDRALIWLDKPKEKRKGGNITLYHGSLDLDKFEKADAFAEYGYKSWKKGDVIEPNTIVPGATALSKPRYGFYFWDNKEYAYEWAVNRAIGFIVGRENRTYKLSHGKAVLIRKENGMSDDDAIKNIIKIAKQKGLDNLKIYESEVSIHDLEITGLSTVKEYTVSKPVTITKVDNVKLTPELLKKHCEFIEHDKFDDYRKNAFKGDIKIERNHSIPMLLALLYMEPDRDAYRGMLLNKLVSSHEDPKEELRKHGGKYRRMLNKSVKQKSSTLVENMVDDMVNIDDDVNDINCISVQDGNVSISNEIIECKLVYENSNARQLFSLTDTNSKLIINDELVIQRDKVGIHCSIKPLYESFEYENSIEFQVTLNGNEELNITDEKISEGVNISSLFKFNDDEYKFIKEACVKIFGVQPKEIKTK